jgi:recombination protein RecR
MRFFAKNGGQKDVCSVCSDDTRDSTLLCIVPRDIDLESIEKSGSYNGHYFVLGGVVPILDKEPEKRIRIKELESRIKENKDIKEIILAMNANQDGENTAEYLKHKFQGEGLECSMLGRGLSTGAELEYADPETLRNAFIHRTR